MIHAFPATERRLDGSNHVFYSNRSVAYTALERFEPALADADECVRLQPGWAKGHQRRAAAMFHLGDLQGAKAGYQATPCCCGVALVRPG